MTRKDKGHFAAKYRKGTRLDSKIAEAIKGKVSEGAITCAAAFEISGELKLKPSEVGIAIDLMETRISRCQLGLFGYYPQKKIVKPAEAVSQSLEQAIKSLLKNNRISCASCWDIAEKLDIPKMKVSAACEKLKIKISFCQLGAFG